MEKAEQIQFKEIADELAQMREVDQEMRKKKHNGGEWDEEVDKKNTERLKEIIKQIGWPTISKVGMRGSADAWLIVQHADLEPDFQKQCLGLMKDSKDDVNSDWVAMLEDRVRVNTGGLQIFGTQFYTNEQGVFGPQPIEDIERLNERRREAGLPPFSEYEEQMGKINEEFQKNKQNKPK